MVTGVQDRPASVVFWIGVFFFFLFLLSQVSFLFFSLGDPLWSLCGEPEMRQLLRIRKIVTGGNGTGGSVRKNIVKEQEQQEKEKKKKAKKRKLKSRG